MQNLIKQLDLEDFLKTFEGFLARPKRLSLQGDSKIHLRYIQALETLQFTPPKPVQNLESQLALLKKFGFLKLDEIFEFVKIIRYFNYLKGLKCEGILGEWFAKIIVPEAILDIAKTFAENGELKSGIYLELDSINAAIERIKRELSLSLNQTLNQNKLQPYLVDRQIHLANGEECLLLKAGFHHILKGHILSRSASGFFYVLPQNIANLKDKQNALNNQKEEQLFGICRDISGVLSKHILFLNFINSEFDRFDNYQARLFFARSYSLEFIAPSANHSIILSEFRHPALKNPKSISLEFDRQILMITGVNAGGKTMLLKSILSAAFLAKLLIPLPINAHKSRIGNFKQLKIILEDPQNSKNDISTFGGRMLEFSQILRSSDSIIGIDEIELGTDSDEAASLFKVLLENLIQKNHKIIITTHHKRLAALMAGNEKVQLLAALFDEEREMPTFKFLSGTIGKSYAFETALRYGIPKPIINEAKAIYGEDKEKLNALIENSSRLEMRLQSEIARAEERSATLDRKIMQIKEKEEALERKFAQMQDRLESSYTEAINAAKIAIKEQSPQAIHRQISFANKLLKKAQEENLKEAKEEQESRTFSKNSPIKYRNHRGIFLGLQRDKALIQLEDGIKLKVSLREIQHLSNYPKPKTPTIKVDTPQNVGVTLDLHGLRADEAIEKLEEFISNSLIAGFDEVLIYHGIGTGRLSAVVRDFLKSHPKVVDFTDAPPKAGGFGAKIVKL